MAMSYRVNYQAAFSHLNRPGPLQRLNDLIPWEYFWCLFQQNLYLNRVARARQKFFDVILMFKVLILQTLYNFSDSQTEYQIRG